ncbi:MAG: hypothetical protein H6Q13_1804 [Bacteroidetes bacterium]|jgi:hypothetical protein|nr:hypothetical protein [Bacteroidota bacterium]
MKKILITILFGNLIFLFSCTKEKELEDKFYYGRVDVAVANLPGTPGLELRINNILHDTISQGSSSFPQVTVAASEPVTLSVYESATGELVEDTTFILNKNENRYLKIACSNDYGIKGWLNGKTVADSTRQMQFVNNLNEEQYPFSSFDLYIYTANYKTGAPIDTVAVFHNFNRGKLYPTTLTLPVYNQDGSKITYVGSLHNHETQVVIPNKGLSNKTFFVILNNTSNYNGTYGIYIVMDDANARIYTNIITL